MKSPVARARLNRLKKRWFLGISGDTLNLEDGKSWYCLKQFDIEISSKVANIYRIFGGFVCVCVSQHQWIENPRFLPDSLEIRCLEVNHLHLKQTHPPGTRLCRPTHFGGWEMGGERQLPSEYRRSSTGGGGLFNNWWIWTAGGEHFHVGHIEISASFGGLNNSDVLIRIYLNDAYAYRSRWRF